MRAHHASGAVTGRPHLLWLPLLAFLSGCTTLVVDDYKSVSVNLAKAQVTVLKTDNTSLVKSVPYETVVQVNKLTGVTYQEANFCFEGLFGGEYVNGGFSLILGHRLVYVGKWGFHDIVSVAPDRARPNALGVGLDYRYESVVFGVSVEEPFSIFTEANPPGLLLGFMATTPY